ncbi:hypothetical protein V6N13_105193 [Hibiscus sabdariffa]|uniref:Uncharacterized protein n=2 Tax=Hibiscus sabdariffa TaxID=183260 RepID=A0ABR2BMM5_9ROSI
MLAAVHGIPRGSLASLGGTSPPHSYRRMWCFLLCMFRARHDRPLVLAVSGVHGSVCQLYTAVGWPIYEALSLPLEYRALFLVGRRPSLRFRPSGCVFFASIGAPPLRHVQALPWLYVRTFATTEGTALAIRWLLCGITQSSRYLAQQDAKPSGQGSCALRSLVITTYAITSNGRLVLFGIVPSRSYLALQDVHAKPSCQGTRALRALGLIIRRLGPVRPSLLHARLPTPQRFLHQDLHAFLRLLYLALQVIRSPFIHRGFHALAWLNRAYLALNICVPRCPFATLCIDASGIITLICALIAAPCNLSFLNFVACCRDAPQLSIISLIGIVKTWIASHPFWAKPHVIVPWPTSFSSSILSTLPSL